MNIRLSLLLCAIGIHKWIDSGLCYDDRIYQCRRCGCGKSSNKNFNREHIQNMLLEQRGWAVRKAYEQSIRETSDQYKINLKSSRQQSL